MSPITRSRVLGLLGQRVGEACAINNIEDLALERGHRTVMVLGKGSKRHPGCRPTSLAPPPKGR